MKKQYINPLTTAMSVVSATILSGSGVTPPAPGQINTGGQQNGIGGAAPARRNTLITGPTF